MINKEERFKNNLNPKTRSKLTEELKKTKGVPYYMKIDRDLITGKN